MRTLLAAVALALALPASATPAAACGGDYGAARSTAVHHTAVGTGYHIVRTDDGRLLLYVSYPSLDGEPPHLYGMQVELHQDRTTRGLERAFGRADRAHRFRIALERTGESGRWHVVAYSQQRA